MVPPPPYVDYIPAADADFATWMIAFSNAYTASGLLIPDPVQVAVDALAFNTALGISTSGATRGPSSIAAKDVQRAITEAIGRLGAQAMIQAYLNGNATAQQLTDAGVRVPSSVATPRLPPAIGPDLQLYAVTPGVIKLAVSQPGAAGYKKEPGVVGAEIWVGVFTGSPPVPPTSLTFAALATRKIIHLPSGAWFGSQVRIQARWVTVRGANSPFGVATDTVAA